MSLLKYLLYLHVLYNSSGLTLVLCSYQDNHNLAFLARSNKKLHVRTVAILKLTYPMESSIIYTYIYIFFTLLT